MYLSFSLIEAAIYGAGSQYHNQYFFLLFIELTLTFILQCCTYQQQSLDTLCITAIAALTPLLYPTIWFHIMFHRWCVTPIHINTATLQPHSYLILIYCGNSPSMLQQFPILFTNYSTKLNLVVKGQQFALALHSMRHNFQLFPLIYHPLFPASFFLTYHQCPTNNVDLHCNYCCQVIVGCTRARVSVMSVAAGNNSRIVYCVTIRQQSSRINTWWLSFLYNVLPGSTRPYSREMSTNQAGKFRQLS